MVGSRWCGSVLKGCKECIFYELVLTVITLHLTLSLAAQIAWILKGRLLKKSLGATYTDKDFYNEGLSSYKVNKYMNMTRSAFS
jgi:hypothetical protein